jgi:DNA-binding NarL/FixJ family response regulator
VLLDVIMPGMSGREVLPKLFEIRPDVRVVITSGQMERKVRRDLDDSRLAGFIQKPCSTDVLLRKFHAFVSGTAPIPHQAPPGSISLLLPSPVSRHILPTLRRSWETAGGNSLRQFFSLALFLVALFVPVRFAFAQG